MNDEELKQFLSENPKIITPIIDDFTVEQRVLGKVLIKTDNIGFLNKNLLKFNIPFRLSMPKRMLMALPFLLLFFFNVGYLMRHYDLPSISTIIHVICLLGFFTPLLYEGTRDQKMLIYNLETKLFYLVSISKKEVIFNKIFSIDDVFALALQCEYRENRRLTEEELKRKHIFHLHLTEVDRHNRKYIKFPVCGVAPYLILKNKEIIKITEAKENAFDYSVELIKVIANILKVPYCHGDHIQDKFIITTQNSLLKITYDGRVATLK